MATTQADQPRRRRPHTLNLVGNPTVTLRFWTVQALELASQAADAEGEGDTETACRLWSLARDTAPADEATRTYCNEHARGLT